MTEEALYGRLRDLLAEVKEMRASVEVAFSAMQTDLAGMHNDVAELGRRFVEMRSHVQQLEAWAREVGKEEPSEQVTMQ